MANARSDPNVAARPPVHVTGVKNSRRWVSKLLWLVLFGSLALNGCARRYVITLSNGTQIGAIGKPKYTGNVYVFKDATGRESKIAAGRVAEIAPASMVQDREMRFNPAPAK